MKALVLMVFSHCNTVFEATGCFYNFCPYQELRSTLTEEDIQCGSEKRDLDERRRSYVPKKASKGFTLIEIWEYEW